MRVHVKRLDLYGAASDTAASITNSYYRTSFRKLYYADCPLRIC
jgi:hypothetical protein